MRRYDFVRSDDPIYPRGQEWREVPEGKWMLAEDVLSLIRENAALREALEAIIKRVALVSPYYEMARAALSGNKAEEEKP